MYWNVKTRGKKTGELYMYYEAMGKNDRSQTESVDQYFRKTILIRTRAQMSTFLRQKILNWYRHIRRREEDTSHEK